MARELGENMSDEELQEMIREADKARLSVSHPTEVVNHHQSSMKITH